MANLAHSISWDIVETVMAREVNSIPHLFAVRGGLVALTELIERQLGQSVISDDGQEPEVYAGFSRACNELYRIDDEIMNIEARSIDDLRMQAAIVRYRSSDGDVHMEHVNLLLAGIDRLAV